jgi:protein-disulfide isomerase
MKTRMAVLSLILLASSAFGQNAVPGRAMGSAVAAISIELYSDFQCPHCKDLYEQTLKQVIRDYVKTGRAYLVERSFPLPQHTFAKPAAYYAIAAERVGKYEQVCDVLFKTQDSWSVTGKVEETACSVLTPAEAAKVRSLAKDPAIAAEVQRDMDLGFKARLQQTPTMLITYNHRTYPVAGAVSYPMLKRFLDNLR